MLKYIFLTDESILSSLEDENQISKSEENRSFDEIIGHIEDLLLGIRLFQQFYKHLWIKLNVFHDELIF